MFKLTKVLVHIIKIGYLRKRITVMSILDLPNELLLLIFSFLTPEELLLNVASVCKRWSEVRKHGSLHKDLVVLHTTSRRFFISSIFRSTTYLSTVKFHHRQSINSDIEFLFALLQRKFISLPNLQAIYFNSCSMIDSDLLCKISHICHIKRLGIENTKFDSNFFDWIAHFASLVSISILGDCWINKYCIDSSIKIIAVHFAVSLEILKINAVHLTAESINDLVQCKHLKILQLHNAILITDSFVVELSKLVYLQSLLITGPSLVQPRTFQYLFSQKYMKNLKSLSLDDYTLLDDETMCCIGNNCKLLENLTLSGCRDKFQGMTEVGLRYVIAGCPKLLYVDLMYTDSCLTKCFYLLPKYLPRLRELKFKPIDETNIHAKRELDNLERNLPQLKIIQT